MTPTIEQAIEIIRQLPPPDREKVRDWIDEENQKELDEKEAKKAESKDEQKKFQLAMKWLDENRQKYSGQWVCLDGDKLISHGPDALQLYEEAREKGIKVPFVEHIVEEKEYGGGIEACPQS